ncbi:MAG: MarR family transcriptional regulator [Haloferacaceae archaeon]
MRNFAELQSDTSKLVLLYLDRVGDASLHEITERLDLSLLTVSATVQHLAEHDFVRRLEDTGRVVIVDEAALEAPVLERAAGR